MPNTSGILYYNENKGAIVTLMTLQTTGQRGGGLNVGGGWWVGQGRVMGGNGDTCNWTTIKK